ncbi:sulfurtransferase TusA family protein [Psychrobacter phenylpyruvicus]|uniref:Sulfurtransferase TusA n=1 Tax=Psychrobacter phenylpyruvicus TaxID=29432 RepID=A0A379LM64_9GAMM|nr:sulfurtransferase TusA family protein [Psychrobacter phenylpyruvicus]SUD91670.1 Sulfurtransferase TusA [Psychrobacter phenylpyruvicus]
MINISLENSEHQALVQSYIDTLSNSDLESLKAATPQLTISALVDGRGMACPMPLLKTKVALRSVQPSESVYILATDPNSQTDLAAFCQQAGLQLLLSTATNEESTDSLEKLDTIFHLIITKTNGN